ncbi:MAG: D-glutamate deacylase [Gemmatimonadetes bacterium]|nr:D-glutamate deacylase [Gemmatimonadota bacterium]
MSFLLSSCDIGNTHYDLVIEGGRVIDPESGLDAVRTIGVIGGEIAAIAEISLEGDRVIQAAGLVVVPGFIDLHEHGQDEDSYRMMVRDGVTTALELEVGTADVEGWYGEREGGQLVNYGVSIGHIRVRMDVLGDPGDFLPAGIGGSATATEEQLDEIERDIREGIMQGAVAVGFGSAYTPGATMGEIERMFAVAGENGVSTHIHMRNGLAGLDSTISAASRAGAPLHIVHANSSAGGQINEFLSTIENAQASGQDVTTEAYPYSAGMTRIESALFDDWENWGEQQFGIHQLVSTGERLTRETFAQARAAGGTVIIHSRTEEMTRAAVESPITMIASDGFIEDGRGHPRTSGSYSKVLGQYTREEGVMTLPEAIHKMTLMPAQRLEARVPDMADKGRIRIGADADITIFNAETVIDRATYMDASIPPEGIPYVVVGGELVVDQGEITTVRPGGAVRGLIR